MAKELNAMFQYGTSNQMLMDTDLVTLDEAIQLFNDHKQDFANRLDNDEDPEMAVWINCKTNASYGETLYHWHSSDMKVIDGVMYESTGITV